jgi:hypothetical protein
MCPRRVDARAGRGAGGFKFKFRFRFKFKFKFRYTLARWWGELDYRRAMRMALATE